MGIIVTLPQPRRKRASAAAATSEATILLFMGVRYVSEHDDVPAEMVAPSALPQHAAACPPLEIA